MTDHRMLLVHAHPDDECINNGATMARYVDEGVGVTLVTCTAGEMGEVLVPELSYLAYEEKGGLGEHRRGELDEAMKVLGVTDHRFLGGFGRFHDSGMAWHEEGHAIPAEEIPDNAFWNADLTEAADELVKVIREVRPQVLVTYDQFGGYGHPDHIQAHRVAMYAAQLAAVPSYRLELGEPHDIAKIYWTAMSESRMRESLRELRESGDTETFKGMEPDGKLPPFVTPDELISARVDGRATVAAEDGRARQARDPGRAGRPLLLRCRERPLVVGGRVLPPGEGHRRRDGRGRVRGGPVRGAVRAAYGLAALVVGLVSGAAGTLRPPALVGPGPGPRRRAGRARLAAGGRRATGVRGGLVRAGPARRAGASGRRLPDRGGRGRVVVPGRLRGAPGGRRGDRRRGTSYARGTRPGRADDPGVRGLPS